MYRVSGRLLVGHGNLMPLILCLAGGEKSCCETYEAKQAGNSHVSFLFTG